MNSKTANGEGRSLRSNQMNPAQHDGISKAGLNLSKVPLNMRARMTTTQWPVKNRPVGPQLQSPSRNYGNGLFRRYPDGQVDIGWAKSVVDEGLRKSSAGIPLTENEALAVTSVFPSVRFEGLPPDIVAVKAFLKPTERVRIQKALVWTSRQALASLGVDLGGS